jgi:hypothetical protein
MICLSVGIVFSCPSDIVTVFMLEKTQAIFEINKGTNNLSYISNARPSSDQSENRTSAVPELHLSELGVNQAPTASIARRPVIESI